MWAVRAKLASRRCLYRSPLAFPLAAIAFGIVALFGAARFFHIGSNPISLVDEKQPWRWIVIVDAGSSGCRAHVFRWRSMTTAMRGGKAAVEVDPTHNNLKVRPGLSTFSGSPKEAGASLVPLIDFVKSEVPETEWGSTGFYLKATAGLRMVAPSEQEAILESVRSTLRDSGFLFNDAMARVIAGTDEGGFGWITVNYLMGVLGNGATTVNAVAVVEMGGASAQVTQFSQTKPPDTYEFGFKYGERDIDLYTHSYLGFGLEKAREQLSTGLTASPSYKDPCLNSGFKALGDVDRDNVYEGAGGVEVVGGSTDQSCKEAVAKQVFGTTENTACTFVSCSFGGIYQPKTLTKTPMLVFENFYYTAKMLGIGLEGTVTPRDFANTAKTVCKLDWPELDAQYPKDDSGKEDLVKLCFSATYLSQFLNKGLGVGMDDPLRIQQTVGEHDIDWALGAALHESAIIAASKH